MTDEFDPHAPGPPRKVAEDAAARERMTAEKQALRVLAWIRTDTAYSEVPPDDEQRESLHRKSLLSRVEDALREAHAAGKAEGAAEELDRSRSREAWLVEVLRAADQFITNGVEMGFIRVPEDDPASATLQMIRSTLEDRNE